MVFGWKVSVRFLASLDGKIFGPVFPKWVVRLFGNAVEYQNPNLGVNPNWVFGNAPVKRMITLS